MEDLSKQASLHRALELLGEEVCLGLLKIFFPWYRVLNPRFHIC